MKRWPSVSTPVSAMYQIEATISSGMVSNVRV